MSVLLSSWHHPWHVLTDITPTFLPLFWARQGVGCVPDKQYGQGHLVGREFTTMDLLSLLASRLEIRLQHISFPSTDRIRLVWLPDHPGQTKIRSPPNWSSLPPLTDRRGYLSVSTCCGGLRLPAPWLSLGITCFPSLGPAATSSFLRSCCGICSGRRGHSWASTLCWRSRCSAPHPGQAQLGEVYFPRQIIAQPLSDPKPASPPVALHELMPPWNPRGWSRQQQPSAPNLSSWSALQPMAG